MLTSSSPQITPCTFICLIREPDRPMLKRMTGREWESAPLGVRACSSQAGSPTEDGWLTHSSSLSPEARGRHRSTDTPERSRGPVRNRVSTEAKQKSTATREGQVAGQLPRTSQREREACPPRGGRQGCWEGPTPGTQGLWPVKTKARPGHSQPRGLGPRVSGQQYTLTAEGGVQTSREACSVAQERGC